MPTEAEELQAKEFLKRAEIRTMRKDLLKLREADSLKERDKIATIKTLEEQQAEQKKKFEEQEKLREESERMKRQEVLSRNSAQEYDAEKDLKKYATEEEKQEIFLFESQRLGLNKQIDEIETKKDPGLKLDKNNILLEVSNWQNKLKEILGEEKKLEDEQKLIAEKAQASTIPSEKKSLEDRRWDLDKQIQDIEKKRWEVEKQIQALEEKIKSIDQLSQQLVVDKNELRNKVLGIDKSLRDVYSIIMARVEEKRRGDAAEQVAARQRQEKLRMDKNEQIQRAQWAGKNQKPEKGFLSKASDKLKEKISTSAITEEDQRKKFLQDVEQNVSKSGSQQQEKSNL